MRVTAKKKQQTQERIVRAARRLFQREGLEGTTTREIAAAAGIATGTLFNYFPTKEALAMAIVAEALAEAQETFEEQRRGDESLDELLFAHIAAGLRHLTPYRRFVGEVVEAGLSPLTAPGRIDAADEVRVRHLETVESLTATMSHVHMHLYWTLYLGVLAFWVTDTSRHQEATLALLDQSMRLFVEGVKEEETDDASDDR